MPLPRVSSVGFAVMTEPIDQSMSNMGQMPATAVGQGRTYRALTWAVLANYVWPEPSVPSLYRPCAEPSSLPRTSSRSSA